MPHNRQKREAEVTSKYDFIVFGGEYSAFNALLIAIDAIITGGNTSVTYLQNEMQQFGIDLAVAMANASPPVDPINETLYVGKFIFQNWEEPFPGVKVPLPNKFVPYVAARKKNPPPSTRPVHQFQERFRAVNDISSSLGFAAGFPNFHQADHGNGVVYGTVLIKPRFVEWRDIPVADLGNPSDDAARFRAVNDWASANGFAAGFPNFHQADYGNGVVYGVQLLKQGAVEWRDILASDLGNPSDNAARFRAVNDWASANGFVSGFPNFHQADHGNGVVYGVQLLKHEAAEWRDILASDLASI